MAGRPKKIASFNAAGSPDPGVVQATASDPAASVWLTASAGTGKTKVLTDRVLRLMLSGAKPDEILCITFTRAAASVMANRIREELSVWASSDDKTLKKKLSVLTGSEPDARTISRARSLFAEFLDSHGGLRIQTIHSFSQSLLRRFPIESGIPPYFDVMDNQTADEALREAQADVLEEAESDPKSPLARAINMITPEVPEDDFVTLIGELTYRRGQLLALIETHGGIEPLIKSVYDYMGVNAAATFESMQAALASNAGLHSRAPDTVALTNAASILDHGTDGDMARATAIKAWLAADPVSRKAMFEDYISTFLTAEGEPRKRLTTKATAKAQDAMMAEAERLKAGQDLIKALHVARHTESLLHLTEAVFKHYTARKRALNMLDFDDLVYQAGLMMEQDNAAGWTLQKLPGDLKHILVDEAQDTNPDQWKLIGLIAREFFADPKRAKEDTIFVVGDEKQSIFSFQRADPREFALRKSQFAEIVKQAGGEWREVEMEIAFRSSPAITEAVDAVFSRPEANDGLFHDGDGKEHRVKHNPFRVGQAGVVEVVSPLTPEPTEPPVPWAPPIVRQEVDDLSVDLAEEIADQIKEWLDKGERLESRDRPISPADIMILVRRRSAFVDHMVRALKKRDIPVAGADRISLRSQIVVMDLMALSETLLFPKDDYKLACVLKSPLVGMNDAQLELLALSRPGSLWDALAARATDTSADKIYAQALEYLNAMRAPLSQQKPYEFYNSVLQSPCPGHARTGLLALYGRLGFEAEDPVVEFMNAAERFEKNHVPTMQGFLSWLSAGEAEVKREFNLSTENQRVHIMTVHGAKGLESPIVILPDTVGVPEDNIRARPRFLWPEGKRTVPLWTPRSDLESVVYTQERERVELEHDREYRRLLYVAMTRAADRLYVYGTQKNRGRSPKSWYSLIRDGMGEKLAGKLEVIQDTEAKKPEADGATTPPKAETTTLRFTVPQTAKPVSDGLKSQDTQKIVGVPGWANKPAKPDESNILAFHPSDYIGNDKCDVSAPSPLSDSFPSGSAMLGTVVHTLLEMLPALPADMREQAAKTYLSRPGFALSDTDQRKTLTNVMAVLNDPKFAALFAPGSYAEASVSGIVEIEGEKRLLSGKIDRLVIKDNTITIVDYKNNERPPKDASCVSVRYLAQMAAYRLALRNAYPGCQVNCVLLYTQGASMVELPENLLDGSLKKISVPLPPVVPPLAPPTP